MSTSKSGGCGCGSAGCAGCGCGTGMCTDESFKRPHFFAGQLLTEDDLQAMTDYVVGKNRLHNRYLFGEGVVCGLKVSCHPCGGATVLVEPGFALDCCGNDLVLPCAEEVDIRALLRDLRKRQLPAYECGDPCEKETDHRHYGLYLTYRETPVDPVAPYNSGDPCGQQGCQPTRICEGYGFELRCECSTGRQADLFAQILACVGNFKSATSAIQRAERLYRAAMANRRPANTGTEAETARSEAVWLKAWLLSKLEQAGSRTRCDLYDRVKDVRLTEVQPNQLGQEPDPADAEPARWLELVRVLLEYFIDCVCLALNPPCSACDDTALLLACVELDGCDVVDICNMSRRFVLSPAAMRYWLPVDRIGDQVKRFCCDVDLSRLLRIEQRQDTVATPAAAPVAAAPGTAAPAAAAPAMDAVAVAAVATPVGDNVRTVLARAGITSDVLVDAADFSTSLAGLALRVGRVDIGALRQRAGVVGDDALKRFLPTTASVIQAPEVRETISAMVKEEVAAGREAVVAAVREQADTSAGAAVGVLATNVSADVDARLSKNLAKVTGDVERRVNKAVRDELAVTKLNGAVDKLAVVKALRKQNETLAAALAALSNDVKKLGAKP